MRRALLAFWPAPLLAGALHWAAYAPLDQGWLAIPAWTLLFLSLRLRDGARAGRQAFVFGCVLFLAGFTWIAPLMVPGWIFTAAWCAGFEALFAWLLARFWLRARRRDWVVGAALSHLLIDMLRMHVLSGFPWHLIGTTGWRNPVLIRSADLIGVHGATLAILLLAAGLAETLARRLEGSEKAWRPLLPAAAVWALLAVWAFLPSPGADRPRPGPVLALLQANIPQLLKEDRETSGQPLWTEEAWWARHEQLAAVAWRRERARGGSIDAVVWPETMVPGRPVPRDLPRGSQKWERLTRIADGATTLAGVQTIDDYGRRWNTVVLVDPRGRALAMQDKRHLAPGGEYIPLRDVLPVREWLGPWLRRSAGFVPDLQAGESVHLLPIRYADGEARAGVLICYESIFPALSRDLVAAGADFLLNASNYGWFVETAVPDQTLAMAAFRAAETRRSMVMASNNGVSAVIGPRGAVRSILRDESGATADITGVHVADVPIASGRTPFVVLGEWPAWGLGLLGLAMGIAARRRRGSHDAPLT